MFVPYSSSRRQRQPNRGLRAWALTAGCMLLGCVLLGGALGGCALAGCGSSDGNGTPDAAVDAAPKPEPLTEEKVLEACVRMAACGVLRHPRLGDCINDFQRRLVKFGQGELYEGFYRCANEGAGDCGVIRQCLGFARKPKACDSSYTSRCEGDVAFNCDLLAKWEQGVDCSKGGLKCALKKSGTTVDAICGGGECDPSSFTTQCKDWKLLQCVGGAIEIIDCPADGLQCRDGEAGVCEGRGRSCQEFAPECDNNKIVECRHGYRREFDCGSIGNRKCDVATATCVAAGTECSTDSFFDVCEGDKLVACVDGAKKTFDCKALGFEGCEKDKVGLGSACKAAPVYDE